MTLYQFKLLDEMEQMEAIWNASPVGEYKNAGYLYKCYQIDDFYVETKKHIEFDVLHGIRSFKTTTLLKPYLDQMDIGEV